MSALAEFTTELQRAVPLPEQLALAIAKIAYPQLESAPCIERIDKLAHYIAEQLDDEQSAQGQAQQFVEIFCNELGFRGNREDYYHPDNSYLNVVLETGEGLPIMLSLLCVAIGRRIHLQIDGIGFPGHFMACLRHSEGDWLLDPFHGRVIAPHEAAEYLASIFGIQPTLTESSFHSVSPEAWAQRILFNLRNIYLSRQDTDMVLQVLDLLLVLTPKHPVLWRERGLLHYQQKKLEKAIRDLRRSFLLFGQFAIVWGTDEQKQATIAKMGSEERHVATLYQNLLQIIRRLN